jgi:protein subunit release factor B
VNFPADAPVTREKRDGLRARLARLGVDLARVEETSIRAGGPGGQKVNKTSSGVRLRFLLGAEALAVKWTRERSHALNRFLALRELADEVEVRTSPQTSERLAERERVRRRKSRSRRRGRAERSGGAGESAQPASD